MCNTAKHASNTMLKGGWVHGKEISEVIVRAFTTEDVYLPFKSEANVGGRRH